MAVQGAKQLAFSRLDDALAYRNRELAGRYGKFARTDDDEPLPTPKRRPYRYVMPEEALPPYHYPPSDNTLMGLPAIATYLKCTPAQALRWVNEYGLPIVRTPDRKEMYITTISAIDSWMFLAAQLQAPETKKRIDAIQASWDRKNARKRAKKLYAKLRED